MGRVLPGFLMAVLWVLLLCFAGAEFFWLIIVVGGGIALHEYYRMSCFFLSGFQHFSAVFVSLLPVLASFSGHTDMVLAGLFGSFFCIILLAFFQYTRLDDVLAFLGRAGFGVFYISLCAAHVVLLRYLPHGIYWLAILTAITIGSDTGAYYAGKYFGRRKLCPSISPGKTVVGAVGGLLTGTVAAMFVGALFGEVRIFVLAFAGLLLVPVGIAGDLTESVIKRATGTKDSGTILAGHGGLLDRIDSLLLTAPVLYYLLFFGMISWV
ncbi:MAG TPA: phosphatidate cytidylyltransferase [Desulfobulbaceae bacterium]|nr:phosphatidate cytidylyltransferase [Desulfobulbaceae bacterium]